MVPEAGGATVTVTGSPMVLSPSAGPLTTGGPVRVGSNLKLQVSDQRPVLSKSVARTRQENC